MATYKDTNIQRPYCFMIKDELLDLLYWSTSWGMPMGEIEVFEALEKMGVTRDKIETHFRSKQ